MKIIAKHGYIHALGQRVISVEIAEAPAFYEVEFSPIFVGDGDHVCTRTIARFPSIHSIVGTRVTGACYQPTTKTAVFYLELSGSCRRVKMALRGTRDSVAATLIPSSMDEEDERQYLMVRGALAYKSHEFAEARRCLDLANRERKEASTDTSSLNVLCGMFRRYFEGRMSIGKGLGPDRNACVANVIMELVRDRRNIIYIATDQYVAEEEREADPRIVKPAGVRREKVINYDSHASRINFSFRCRSRIQLRGRNGKLYDRDVYRTYHVIRDGKLYLRWVWAVLTPRSFAALKTSGAIREEQYVAGKAYRVWFTDMPLVSSSWARPQTMGLVNLLKEAATLKARVTQLHQRMAELPKPPATQNRVQGMGGYVSIYRGPTGKKIRSRAANNASCSIISLVKFKPKPFDASSLTYDEAEADLWRTEQRLTIVRFILRCICLSLDKVDSKVIPWNEARIVVRGRKKLVSKNEQFADFNGAHLKRTTWIESSQ